MRSMKIAAVFAAGLLAAACGTTEIDDIRGMTAPTAGTDFTKGLASGYRAFALDEANIEYDWPDAYHFARKGLAAGGGQVVLPEDPGAWNIASDKMPELQQARGRLMAALDGNGRTRLPRVAAGAQVAYDCWVEQQEEGWQLDDIAACKRDFYNLLAQLEARPAPPPAPAAAPAARQFIVFFDFDRSTITAEGQRIIQQVIASYRQKSGPIAVVGHTDRSGTPQYNQGLSVRRANSVKAALVRGGVPAPQVSTAGRGESEPRVPTPDGVREPQNRRAEITIR